MVLIENDQVADKDRRAAGAEVVLERAERTVPQEFAVPVVTVEAAGAKKTHHALVVGRGTRLRVAASLVDFLETMIAGILLPNDLSVGAIERDGDEMLVALGREKDPLADDDRRRMPRRQRSFPDDVLLGADFVRQGLIDVRQTARVGSAKLRPRAGLGDPCARTKDNRHHAPSNHGGSPFPKVLISDGRAA